MIIMKEESKSCYEQVSEIATPLYSRLPSYHIGYTAEELAKRAKSLVMRCKKSGWHKLQSDMFFQRGSRWKAVMDFNTRYRHNISNERGAITDIDYRPQKDSCFWSYWVYVELWR